MKAIAKTRSGPGAELIEVAVPKPRDGELLVRVAACGVCGSDLHVYLWELGAERMMGRIPFVIGHEPAGEVVEVGPGVGGFKVVMADDGPGMLTDDGLPDVSRPPRMKG